jgi:signal transduction histidine kinase
LGGDVLGGALTIWRARLPDAVGTPAGERRPMLPAWPFLGIAAASLATTLFMSRTLDDRWFVTAAMAVVVAGPGLIVHRRVGIAAVWVVLANLVAARVTRILDPELGYPPWFLNNEPVQLAVAFMLGVTLPGRLAGAALAVIGVSGVVFAAGQPAPLLAYWPQAATWLALQIVAVMAGARTRDRFRQTLLRIADGEREQVQSERDRIARELHDVVAHHMSVIAVRAVSASRRIEGLPAAAVTEFAELGAAAREALGELRQLLGMLDDPGAAIEREPQPGLGELPRVVERARGAGAVIELEVAPSPGVPVAVAVSAYRIVQEALSNVTRHATGAATHVRVAPDESGDRLLVDVENEPPGPVPEPSPGAGRGMIGMRERARLLGGDFDAGATPSGGFAVRASLPLKGAR